MPETKKNQTVEQPIPSEAVNDQAILKELLGNLPSNDEVEVELPSRNKFYNLVDPAKPITLRPMTFEDEKSMMSNKNPNVDAINSLLARCVGNINISHILQLDKMYLIMKLREISYGDDYSAVIGCPGCRKESNVKFKLSQLLVNYLDSDSTNPVDVHLPVLDKNVKVRLPRIEDERYFQSSELATANMWRFVEEIEGHTSKTIISQVVQQLPLKDAHAVLNALGAVDIGVDTNVRFVCSFCSHSEVMELPITADFFTVK